MTARRWWLITNVAMMASYGSEGDNSQVLFRVENARSDRFGPPRFSDGSEDVFFTGGDDCKLVKHDLREMKEQRTSGDEEEPSNFAYPSPTSQNFRFEKNPVFDAGVTSIESKAIFIRRLLRRCRVELSTCEKVCQSPRGFRARRR